MAISKLVAVITARGGSKGLLGKNLAMIKGIPLLAYSIRAGIECPSVKRVVVTTDDVAIADVARQYGAQVVTRPATLATDTARSEDAVRHVLDKLAADGEQFDLLALLQPTSPLRTANHLYECVERFHGSGAGCIISVVEETHHPYKALTLADGWLSPLFDQAMLSSPRQLLPRTYRPNGAIYLIGCDTFRSANSFYVEPAMPYVMTSEESVDIDTAKDLAWVRFLMETGHPPAKRQLAY